MHEGYNKGDLIVMKSAAVGTTEQPPGALDRLVPRSARFDPARAKVRRG